METDKKLRAEEVSYKPFNPEDFGYSQQLQEDELKEAQPTKQSKANEILQRIYKTNVPEPVFDQAKADRLKRMGRVNQMGNGLSVLGDMLATGLGAPVKRRQEDGTAARLYQSYENNLDKHKNDKDVYSLRKLSKSLDDAKLGLSEERRSEQMELANRKQAAYEKAKEADDKLNREKWEAEYNRKLKADEMNAKYKAMDSESRRISANKTGATGSANQPKKIQTAKTTYEMTPAEYSFRRERALKNSDLLKERFANMFINTPKLDKYQRPIPGQFDTSLNPEIKDDDLVRADLELEENPQPKAKDPGQVQKEAGAEQEAYIQNEIKKTKTDPLGLGISTTEPKGQKKDWSKYARPKNATPKNATSKNATSKIDYSKLNYGDQEGQPKTSTEPKQVKKESNPFDF